MVILRKSIKIQILGLLLFGLLTVIIALLLMMTPFKEAWSYPCAIAALCISCLLVGTLEGKVVSKRGLIIGVLASIVTLTLIFVLLNALFNGDFKVENSDIILTIPLIFGAVGGVVGTNSNK